MEENKEVFDWKKELREAKQIFLDARHEFDKQLAIVDEKVKRAIELGGKDAEQEWNEFAAYWKEKGRIINWKKWRYVYIACGLIIFGLVLHYVFGV